MKARVFFSVTQVAFGLSLAIAGCGGGQAVTPAPLLP